MANATNLTDMLKHLGWGSGFKLPIANEENKELEKILEMKQSKLVNMNTKLQETQLAVENSTSVLKHLKSKILHLKDVEAAKRGQMEKEKDFHALAQRDYVKSEQDIKKVQKQLHQTKQRNSNTERNIIRRKDALGELVDTINFDKKAIVEYENKFSKEDAYIKLMEDFAETDNEKHIQCKKQYQQLGEKIVNSQRLCNQTILESEVMEGELEALAKRFRKAHSERNQFIENWQNTLQAMEQRDKEIMDMGYEYKKASLYFRKSSDLLSKQESFYENIKNETSLYVSEAGRIDRIMGTLYARKRQEDLSSDELSDGIAELAAYIYTIEKEAKSLAKQFKSLNSSTNEWKEKISKSKLELERLQAKYDVFSLESMTSSEQVKQLQDFLDAEERKTEALAQDLMKQTSYKSQRQRQCLQLKYDITSIEAEARGLRSSISGIKRKCSETGDTIVKVKSVAYGLDIQCMNLASKVRGLEDPGTLYSKEEYTRLVKRIGELRTAHQESLKVSSVLRTQTIHCDGIIVTYQKEIMKEGEEIAHYERKLHTLKMEIRRITKDGDSSLELIKDVGVTNSLLHVQLKRMMDSIKNFEEKMLDLEHERVSLHAAAKTRQKDIENYYALLQSKKRLLQDESQKLKAKILEVSTEADARKRKYEMVIFQMWSSTSGGMGNEKSEEGSNGSDRSEAYFIIKIAQEREHYRQEGDKWDERVKEAEKVVEGLQNTLALMMGTNEAFKESLKPATPNTKEGQQMQELKEQQYETAHNLKLIKERRIMCIGKLKEAQLRLDNSLTEKNQLEHGVMERQYELKILIEEISGQKEKIRRATLQANKLVKELSKVATLDTTLLQNDLRLRVTKEKFEFAVATLERLLSMYPYLIEDALEFLTAKDMIMLRDKLLRKLIAPTLFTPSESARSTFSSGRPSTASFIRRSTRNAAVSYASSLRQSGGSESVSKPPARSMKRSIVFSTMTASPSIQNMLENITKGMANAQNKKAENKNKRASTSSHQTGKARGTWQTNDTGISFGELRKVLQDVVTEQNKQTQMDEDSNEEVSVREPKPSADIVELVDNKSNFNVTSDRASMDDLG